jgi:hypothetical protein
MVPLLPKTVILDLLVIFAGKMASIENPFLPTLLLITLYSSQNLFIGIFLEVTKNVRQADVGLVSTYYHVQMIGHQYPRVDIKTLLLLTICKGLNHDMLIDRTGEYIHPVNDCACREIQFLGQCYCCHNLFVLALIALQMLILTAGGLQIMSGRKIAMFSMSDC